MNDALIARLGLDKESFDAGLRNAVKNAADAQAKMTAIAKKEEAKRKAQSGHGSNGGNRAAEVEDVLRGERKVERGIGQLTTSIVQFDSVSGVATAGVEALHSVFKAPLALGIGIAAAAAGYEKLSAAAEKAKERHEENAKLFRAPVTVQAAQKPAEMKRDIGELTAAGDETKKTLESYPTILADFWKSYLTGSESVVAKLMDDQNKIEQRKHELSAALATSIREEGQAREVSLNVSEREGEILQKQAETAAEIARIKIEGAAGLIRAESMHAQLKDAGSKGAEELELINRKFEILEIKRNGLDVETKEAEARVRAAQVELSHAHTSEAKSDATLRLTAEKDALEAAKRITAERQAQLGITVAIATMQADASAREMARLQMESAEIARQMETSKPDETAGLFARQTQNQSAQADLLNSHSERMFALADQMAQSSAGPDQASQMRSIQARATIADSHAEALESNPRATVEQLVEARDQAEKLRMEYEKIKQANGDVLNDTRAENRIMFEVLHGHDALAEKLKIEKDYHDKIQKARREGNTELAHTLTMQEQLAQAQAERNLNKSGKGDKFIADPAQSPAEQNAARLAWLKAKQARGAADRKDARDTQMQGHEPGSAMPDAGQKGKGPDGLKDLHGQPHMDKTPFRPRLMDMMGGHMPDRSFAPIQGQDMGAGQYGPKSVTPEAPAASGGFSKADLGDVQSLLQQVADKIDTVGKDV